MPDDLVEIFVDGEVVAEEQQVGEAQAGRVGRQCGARLGEAGQLGVGGGDDDDVAGRLAEIDGVSIDLDVVGSNIVIFKVEPAIDQAEFVAAMRARGVLVSNYGTRGARMVTHYGISDDDIAVAIETARQVMAVPVAA